MGKRVLVIGGGPAGLACAYRLSNDVDSDFTVDVVESASQVGGISKTVEFNGYYYDLGGHRFFSKIEEVNALWDEVLPEDFLTRKRLSRIYYNRRFYNYPLQISNALGNLGLFESFLIGLSYFKSKLFSSGEETNFEQWVTNRFGSRLYRTFFKTYTEKVWGVPCREIQAEWAAQRIKGLSLISAILNTLPGIRVGNIKTLIDEFKYPKYGPGMMYDAMAKAIEKNGNCRVRLNSRLSRLSYSLDKWLAEIEVEGGGIETGEYDEVVSTMPLTELILNMDYDVPSEIKEISRKLKYRGFLIVCLAFKNPNTLEDNWIYIHEGKVKLGRVQVLNNWSPFMVKDESHASYGAEYFVTKGDELYNTPDDDLVKLAVKELTEVGLLPEYFELIQGNVVRVDKAYPVYDEFYGTNIKKLIDFMRTIPHLQVAGRTGMFKYNNMDHSIYTGLLTAQNLVAGEYKYDIWQVNQDEEYHEEESLTKKEAVVDVFEANAPVKRYGAKID